MKFFTPKKIIAAIVVLAAIAAIVIYFQGFSGRADAGVDVDGPAQIFNGQQNDFKVRVENKSGHDWDNARLIISVPVAGLIDSQPVNSVLSRDLGEIRKGQSREISFKGRFFGVVGEEHDLSFKLQYQPRSSSSYFENEKSLHFKIIGNVVEINFDSLEQNKSGQIVASLTVTNKDRSSFDDLPLTLNISYPDKFTFISSEPPAEKSSQGKWYLNNLKPDESRKFVVKGWISGGNLNNLRPFTARLTAEVNNQEISLSEANSLNQVSAQGLVVFQSLESNTEQFIDWGSRLNFRVNFRNATTVARSDLALSVKFDNPALIDFSRSDLGGGSYDASSSTLTFDKNSSPALSLLGGGQENSIRYSLTLVANPVSPGKNNYFKSTASIKSRSASDEDELSAQDIFSMPIRTKVGLLSNGYYQNQYFQNYGSMPPKANTETSFAFVLQITNNSNDLKSVRVFAPLGQNTRFSQAVFPKNAPVKYDESQKAIIWDVGLVPAGTGYTLPAKQVAFQLIFSPTENQVGQLGLLLGQARLTAFDSFASSAIEALSVGPIYTDLPYDPSVQGQGIITR